MKSEKIILNKDFKRVYGRGNSHVSPLLVTYVLKNNSGKLRIGITTGKKIGGAVERNRARRVIAAAFRETISKIDCNGADIVFVARTKTVSAKSYNVAAAMKKHFIEDRLWSEQEK